MKVDGKHWRSIWPEHGEAAVGIIDQRLLPHEFRTLQLTTLEDACEAIGGMAVRGAPLIGATAAYGICLAANVNPDLERLRRAGDRLVATRPTAVNLAWAVERVLARVAREAGDGRRRAAWDEAALLCEEDVAINHSIGGHGLGIVRDLASAKGGARVDILTHCNAGWLACVDWGTATSAIYQAQEEGIDVHVWVDETRPRNQGASLTAWELGRAGVPHTVIADNAGGHLMQHGRVDMCIVGTDRTTACGDVCNKVGTYLKALAAHDNGVPFYVALPSPTIDASLDDGLAGIRIEERSALEVSRVRGRDGDGVVREVDILPPGCAAANPAFDVTPARLVTGLITERGVVAASRGAVEKAFPELFAARAAAA